MFKYIDHDYQLTIQTITRPKNFDDKKQQIYQVKEETVFYPEGQLTAFCSDSQTNLYYCVPQSPRLQDMVGRPGWIGMLQNLAAPN